MKARRSIRSPRRRQYPGSHPRSSHPPSPMYVLMVSPTPACRVAEGRAASNIWSRLGRVCGTNHTDRGCRDGGHFEIEHIRIGDGEMDPACGKSLLRQSSTATDRFRNLTPAIGPRPWERVFMPLCGHSLRSAATAYDAPLRHSFDAYFGRIIGSHALSFARSMRRKRAPERHDGH